MAKSLRGFGCQVVCIGRPASLEERLIRAEGFPFYPVPASGFFGKGLLKKLAFFLRFGAGFFRSCVLISKLEPLALVATGSFISLAPLCAAIVLKKRFYLLEQNRIPGRLTRYLAGFAATTYLNFPVEKPLKGKIEILGNPLRPEILKTVRRSDGKTVLFLGGSQGAHQLNVAALKAAAQFPELHFIIVTGERDFEFVQKNLPTNSEAIPFTTAPEDLYARADLVVSRAGATALAEILSLGLPAILVPFPFATDQHQLANGRYLAAAGAARLLDEKRIEELPPLLKKMITDKPGLTRLSENAKNLARRDSAQTIARSIMRCSAA